MAMNRHYRGEVGWIVGVLTGLLVVLMPVLVVWSQDTTPRAEETGQAKMPTRLRITVQQGRLSVDLRGADIRAVLAQIGEQGGVRMVFSQNSTRKVSAQFAGVELEEGLRRLLQQASLSYIVLYGPGPTGASVVREVRVVGEKGGVAETAEAPERTPAPQAAVERDRDAHNATGDATSNPFHKILEQVQATGQLSPGTAPPAAAPLNDQEAVNLLRGLFQSPHSGGALRELRAEPEDAAGSSH
jgi:hypothetical protein